MANAALNPTVVTKEALTILHNNITFCRNVNRQYDNSNSLGGQKNGGSIKVRLPNKYVTNTGAALATGDNLDTVEKSVTITQSTQRHVDTSFTSQELTQDIDTFSERILQPGVSVLASMFDYDVMAETLAISNSVGTPGTTPATAGVLLDSHKYMNYFAVPQSNRFACLNPDANASMVDGLKGLFNNGSTLSDQYKSGLMANNQLGFKEMSMSQNVRSLTTGTRLLTDTMLIDEDIVTEGGTTVDIDGVTGTETVVVGDVFTVAGCFSVNPETKASTGKLMQFTVTAAKSAAGNQFTALAFQPAVYTSASEGLQNVTGSSPATAFVNGNAVTFLGEPGVAYAQNIAFHKDTFVVATTDLEVPEGVHFAAREVMDGISMRIVRQYRIDTDDIPCRIDLLYGAVAARPETACRIWG